MAKKAAKVKSNSAPMVDESSGGEETLSPKKDLMEEFREKTEARAKEELESAQSVSTDWSALVDYEVKNPDFSAQDFIEVAEALKMDLLQHSSPDLGVHCKQILQNLTKYEELSFLLKPDQIGVIVNGLAKYSNVKIVPQKKNKSTKDLARDLELAGGQLEDLL